MDIHRFDAITKTLAAGASRRRRFTGPRRARAGGDRDARAEAGPLPHWPRAVGGAAERERAMRLLVCITVVLLASLTSKATAQEQVGTTTQPLIGEQGVEYWTARNNIVPVCWETPGYDREKRIVHAAVTGTWQFWANVDFTFWATCPTSSYASFVRVKISPQGDANAGADGSATMGTAALARPDEAAQVNLTFQAGLADRGRVEYVGVHEFGHVLGFGHEQDAPDNEGPARCNKGIDTSVDPLSITAYDRDSVMNYCNRDGNMTGSLTDTDIRGVQQIYGVRRPDAAARNSCQSALFAGRASLAGIWNDQHSASVAVFPSDGTHFLSHQQRSVRDGGWGDDIKWVSGDFDGNGLTDIGAAWNNGGHATLTVRLAQPDQTFVQQHWLVDAGGWLDSTVYLAGDFNGDGKADIAGAWNNGGQASIAVFLSDGTKFPGWTQWSDRDGGWSDTVKWVAGDFDGDGKTDIGAAWNNDGLTTLTVRRSDGTAFTQAHWLTDAGRWFDASVFLAGDFNGDGQSDIAQLWNDLGQNSIKVYLADGSAFATAAAWATRDGGIPLLVKWVPGDFNGDGTTDIAAVWENNGGNVLTVRSSTGTTFVAAHWSTDNGGWIPTTAWCAGTFDPTAGTSGTGASLVAAATPGATPVAAAATPGATPVVVAATPGATPVVVATEPLGTAAVGPPPMPATIPAPEVPTETATVPATQAATEPATAPPTDASTATSTP